MQTGAIPNDRYRDRLPRRYVHEVALGAGFGPHRLRDESRVRHPHRSRGHARASRAEERRRRELEDESAFFGSMDGASKFVRGEAIASLIIIAVNIYAVFVNMHT